MRFISLVFLAIAIILQSSITTLPLVFIVILNLTVYFKENFIFALAFFGGLILDFTLFNTAGISSIYLVLSMLIVLLYQRKFEIKTYYFVGIASFLGSLGYLIILGFSNLIILQALVSSLISIAFFAMLKRFVKLNSVKEI